MYMRKKDGFLISHLPGIAAILLVMSVVSGCGDAKQVENEQSLRQIGLNQLDKGDYESAIHAFDKALNERVGIVSNLEEDINFYKAYAQIEAGKTQDAIDTYTALIEYDKKNSDAYYLRGCAYMSTEDTDLAVEDFEQAIKYKDDSGELYAGIYEQLMDAGLSEEAASYLEQGLELKGDSAAACLTRGRLYLAGGYYDKAVTELKAALEKKEMSANLYLGETFRAQGKKEDAKAYYEAYAKDHPQDSKVLYELGNLAFEEGAYNEAVSYYEQGLSCKSIVNKQGLWSGKIAALEYKGDFAGAKQEMESYLESYPQDEQAKREYIFLKSSTANTK